MAMKTIICLSFIVLNNFFANMCVKKNCASPTKSLAARHCLLVSKLAYPTQNKFNYLWTIDLTDKLIVYEQYSRSDKWPNGAR